jgi:hypothetical protein
MLAALAAGSHLGIITSFRIRFVVLYLHMEARA